jgi:hypothetical protein
VVDAANVEDLMVRENSPELTYGFYHDLFADKYSDMNSMAKAFPGTEQRVITAASLR